MIDYSHNHLQADVAALLTHVGAARGFTDDPVARNDALFRAELRLMRAEKELARMCDVIREMEVTEEVT